MRKYEEPSMDIIIFISEDVVTASNGGTGGNEGGFDYYSVDQY